MSDGSSAGQQAGKTKKVLAALFEFRATLILVLTPCVFSLLFVFGEPTKVSFLIVFWGLCMVLYRGNIAKSSYEFS